MIDTDKIDNMKQWTNDYKVRMFWDLVAEVKRLREEVSSVIREMLSDSEEDPSWGATVHAYIKDLQKVIE